jgi:hypothetical protein
VSNFEQTAAVYICCFANHRGIALSGPNPTPPSIIALGGVVLSRASQFLLTRVRPSRIGFELRTFQGVNSLATSRIPLHLQRKFEQRWAAKFGSPVASAAPKSASSKGTVSNLPRPASQKKDPLS